MTKLVIKKSTPVIHKNEALGLVFGFGMVCATKNDKGIFEPYVDLQDDWIAEEEMFKASVEFAQGDRVAKAMHSDTTIGDFPFIMPGTAEVFKAFGITEYDATGLMLAMKPADDYLTKFMGSDPEWTGFSIGCTGTRVAID